MDPAPNPPLPEPMRPERWWERSAFKQAVGTVAGIWLSVLAVYGDTGSVSRASIVSALSATIIASLLCWGVVVADRAGYRRG